MSAPRLEAIPVRIESLQLNRRVQELVGEDLSRVEKTISGYLHSPYAPVAEMGVYIAASKGKRIRPSLLLLASRMLGYQGDRHIQYAAIFEFIHTATLIHDDIVDQALLRRGRASLSARWGPELAVLMGDRVFIMAMNLAVKEGWSPLLPLISDTTLRLVEGELIQSHRKWDLTLSREDHLEIIKNKTAHLFLACAVTPAYLAGASEELTEALRAYGLNLGIAFQMVDDCLDFAADEATLGKPVGHDLKEGKITLPILLLLERGTTDDRAFLEAVVTSRRFDTETLREVAERVSESGMLEKARGIAASFANEALRSAQSFPDGPAKDLLVLLPEYILKRRY